MLVAWSRVLAESLGERFGCGVLAITLGCQVRGDDIRNHENGKGGLHAGGTIKVKLTGLVQ